MNEYGMCVNCKWCRMYFGFWRRLFRLPAVYKCMHPKCLKAAVDNVAMFANDCYKVRNCSHMCYYEGRYYEPIHNDEEL